MDLGLTGSKAIVTGATRGIGRSIAEHLAAEGCHVGICARTAADVHDAVGRLRALGVHAVGDAIDVGDPAVPAWIDDVASELGGLDVFVSNVSAQSFEWQRSFDIDVLAGVRAIDAAIPHVTRSRHGSIVGVASQAALLSVPSYKPYSAMKAALISYLSSLSRELAPRGVRVNAVSPGETVFPGGFWERIEREDPELYERTLRKNPMGRLGMPDEVARAVMFLASPAASFVAGANLLVDGAGREHVQY